MKKVISVLSFFIIFSNAYSNNADSISSGRNSEITDSTYFNNSDSLSTLKSAEITDTTSLNSDSLSSITRVELTDTTEKCTIITKSNKYPGVKIYGFGNSSVKILASKFTREIQIKDIRSIKFKGGGFWKGALIGGGAAFFLGLLPYMIFNDTAASSQENNNNLLLGGVAIGTGLALPFALVGGLIGQKDKEFDFKKLNYYSKKETIRHLIKEYSKK